MPAYPDEYLPPRTVGLEEFLYDCRDFDNADDGHDFLRYALAGRLEIEEVTHRLFINPTLNLDAPDAPTISGDFDSLIGLTKQLPFTQAISIHAVPPFRETLTRDVHLTYPVVRGVSVFFVRLCLPMEVHIRQANTVQVPLHKIPNYMFAKYGVRHQVRVFFPRRYDPLVSPAISPEHFTNIYNDALLPTIKEVLPEAAAQWPNNYRHATTLARGRGGQLGTITNDLPQFVLEYFAPLFLENLAAMGEQFEDAFFEVEARGVKLQTVHDPADEDARREALEKLLTPLDLTLVPEEEVRTRWFVDVALDIHQEGYVLQWLTNAHARLIRHALPAQASRADNVGDTLVKGTHFHRDLSGHLTDLAGFRLEPRSRGVRDHVVYMNVYTTDKAATYQQNNGVYRRRGSYDLVPGKMDKLLADIETINSTFMECAGRDGVIQDGTARFEIRVNAAFARESLTAMPEELLEQSVLAVPASMWWYVQTLLSIADINILSE